MGPWFWEDATGRLKTARDEYAASVIGQHANLIQVHLEGMTQVPPGIPRGMLIIDDTALLRKLAAVLEESATNPTSIGPLAYSISSAFAKVGYSPLPEIATLVKITGETLTGTRAGMWFLLNIYLGATRHWKDFLYSPPNCSSHRKR